MFFIQKRSYGSRWWTVLDVLGVSAGERWTSITAVPLKCVLVKWCHSQAKQRARLLAETHKRARFFFLLVSGFTVTWRVESCIISSRCVEVFQSSAALTVVTLSNSHLTRVTTHPQNIYHMTSFHILLASWHRTWKKTLGRRRVLLIRTVRTEMKRMAWDSLEFSVIYWNCQRHKCFFGRVWWETFEFMVKSLMFDCRS